MNEPSSTETELRQTAALLKQYSLKQELPYATFYFSLLKDHFVAQGMRAQNEKLAAVSPFIYAMQ